MSGSLATICARYRDTIETECLHVYANTGPAAAALSLRSGVRHPLAVTSHELLMSCRALFRILTLVEAQQDVVPI